MINRGSLSWPDSYTPYASFSSTILQRKVIHFKMKCDKSINLFIDKNYAQILPMVNLVASSDYNDIVHLFIAHFYKSDIETF